MSRSVVVVASIAAQATVSLAADAPRLSLPIACEPGKTCFIQSYVDIDPGPEARDFACGAATYDGHKGTDFRVLSWAAANRDKVAVLAAADGTVIGSRDGMADVGVEGKDDPRIKNRECGNGVVLDHGSGWETQYCHLMKGSVEAKSGDRIKRGQKLGFVGNSGLAAFAHVHLEVRKDGKPVDPFTGAVQDAACLADHRAANGLWDEAATRAFAYVSGEIISAGFTATVPTRADLETDHDGAGLAKGAREAHFAARVANIRSGDRVRLTLEGPAGFRHVSEGKPLDRNRQLHIEYATARSNQKPLPSGTYRGTAELIRDASVIGTRSSELTLN